MCVNNLDLDSSFDCLLPKSHLDWSPLASWRISWRAWPRSLTRALYFQANLSTCCSEFKCVARHKVKFINKESLEARSEPSSLMMVEESLYLGSGLVELDNS